MPNPSLDAVLHHFCQPLYAKEMRIPRGWTVGKHQHDFSHLSILAKGEVMVTVDGKRQYYESPACVHIAAGSEHTIHALSDAVWFCIHSVAESDWTSDPAKVDAIIMGKGPEGE